MSIPRHMTSRQFLGGLLLALLAAAMMLFSEVPLSAPIALLVVGVVLIATSRRRTEC